MDALLPGLAIALAAFLIVDGVACSIPIRYIAADLARLGVSPKLCRMLGPIKLTGAVGLIIGLWIPALGFAAALGVALYFIGAVSAHARAKDTWWRYLAAIGLFLFAAVVARYSYAPVL